MRAKGERKIKAMPRATAISLFLHPFSERHRLAATRHPAWEWPDSREFQAEFARQGVEAAGAQ